MPLTPGQRWVRALFGAVLHLYPASYRDEYGGEMTLVLVDRLRGEHNAAARVVMFLGANVSVLADAPKQHAIILAQDLRLALRLIRRERWFAAVAIGTVAVGIALSTAVFSRRVGVGTAAGHRHRTLMTSVLLALLFFDGSHFVCGSDASLDERLRVIDARQTLRRSVFDVFGAPHSSPSHVVHTH